MNFLVILKQKTNSPKFSFFLEGDLTLMRAIIEPMREIPFHLSITALFLRLHVLNTLRTRFRVNLHSINTLMSRNFLLETGAISEVQMDCNQLEPTPT